MKKQDYLVRTAAELFAMFLWAEGVFRVLTFPLLNIATVRIILFTAAASLFIAGICGYFPEKIRRKIVYAVGWFIAGFTIVELTMIHYLGNYTSIKAGTGMLGGGAPRGCGALALSATPGPGCTARGAPGSLRMNRAALEGASLNALAAAGRANHFLPPGS